MLINGPTPVSSAHTSETVELAVELDITPATAGVYCRRRQQRRWDRAHIGARVSGRSRRQPPRPQLSLLSYNTMLVVVDEKSEKTMDARQ